MSSLTSSFMPSARVCSQPNLPPTRVGPRRSWMRPATLRSSQTEKMALTSMKQIRLAGQRPGEGEVLGVQVACWGSFFFPGLWGHGAHAGFWACLFFSKKLRGPFRKSFPIHGDLGPGAKRGKKREGTKETTAHNRPPRPPGNGPHMPRIIACRDPSPDRRRGIRARRPILWRARRRWRCSKRCC